MNLQLTEEQAKMIYSDQEGFKRVLEINFPELLKKQEFGIVRIGKHDYKTLRSFDKGLEIMLLDLHFPHIGRSEDGNHYYTHHEIISIEALLPEGWHIAKDELGKFDRKELNLQNAGFMDPKGEIHGKGSNSYFWEDSSSMSSEIYAWGRTFYYGESRVSREHYNRSNGFSVRCVKNIEKFEESIK